MSEPQETRNPGTWSEPGGLTNKLAPLPKREENTLNQIELLSLEDKDPLDVAYIAGLFDGEGSVYINKVGSSYTIILSIAMNDSKAPEKCKQIFGGKIYTKKQRGAYPPLTQWMLTGKHAAYFLKTIQPFLLTKAESTRIVLEFYNRYWLPGRNKISLRRLALGEEYRQLLSKHQSRVSKST